MVEITPFTGLLYNPEKTGKLSNLTAPPYDVIKPHHQEILYDKHPNNIVRLILGKQYEGDTEENNRYTRSAKDFEDWISKGILKEDSTPHYYAYGQEYDFKGSKISRIGFFARVKLEDYSSGNICPHEFTLAKAKHDRSLLLSACRANFSPIFGLFSDPEHAIDKCLLDVCRGTPIGTVKEEGIVHSLWRIKNKDAISFLTRSMLARKIYIADGHHRYETALAYYKSREPEDDSTHVMMFLTNLDSDSLTVFPIHRVIKSRRTFHRSNFISHLEENFDVEHLPQGTTSDKVRERLESVEKNRTMFAVYLKGGEIILLTVSGSDSIGLYLKQEEPLDLRVLDVVQLHAMIIRSVMDVDTMIPEHQKYVLYTIDMDLGMEKVESGKYDAAFFMNPTRVEQVRLLAEKGIRLPQKATYFYPKLLSGLVLNKFQS